MHLTPSPAAPRPPPRSNGPQTHTLAGSQPAGSPAGRLWPASPSGSMPQPLAPALPLHSSAAPSASETSWLDGPSHPGLRSTSTSQPSSAACDLRPTQGDTLAGAQSPASTISADSLSVGSHVAPRTGAASAREATPQQPAASTLAESLQAQVAELRQTVEAQGALLARLVEGGATLPSAASGPVSAAGVTSRAFGTPTVPHMPMVTKHSLPDVAFVPSSGGALDSSANSAFVKLDAALAALDQEYFRGIATAPAPAKPARSGLPARKKKRRGAGRGRMGKGKAAVPAGGAGRVRRAPAARRPRGGRGSAKKRSKA